MKFFALVIFSGALVAATQANNTRNSSSVEKKVAKKAVPDPDFEEFLRLQIEVERASRDDQQALETMLQQSLELLKSFQDARNAQLSALNAEVNTLKGTVSSLSSSLQETRQVANDALTKFQTCVTDVRFGTREYADGWYGPGFADTKSFVITGIANHNENEFSNDFFRRKVQIQRSGNWVEPAWL